MVCAFFLIRAILQLESISKTGNQWRAIPSQRSVVFPLGLPLSLCLPGPKEYTQQLMYTMLSFTMWGRKGRRVRHSGFGIRGHWWPAWGEDSGCVDP